MNHGLIEKTEEDKIIEVMCQILELKECSEEIVKAAVKKLGLRHFFKSFDALDIEDNEKDRIRALKEVIDTKEKEIIRKEGDESYGY